MGVDLDVLVLPAFDDLDGLPGELGPWRSRYDFSDRLSVPGVSSPLRHTESGLAVVPTGIGKPAAATTTTALLGSDAVDLDGTLVLSVGVAGGPPSLPVGSVLVADAIVDWDHKCRVDASDGTPLVMNPYTGGLAFDLDADLVAWARKFAASVSLESPARSDHGDGPGEDLDDRPDPSVVTGTNLCGDELWHGEELADQADWLVEQHGAGPYRATEMEDAGTAFAMEQFDRLDQYLSIRGISNHDRPTDDETARESLVSDEFEDGFGVGARNAVEVAATLVDEWPRD